MPTESGMSSFRHTAEAADLSLMQNATHARCYARASRRAPSKIDAMAPAKLRSDAHDSCTGEQSEGGQPSTMQQADEPAAAARASWQRWRRSDCVVA
ncbi:hypothetical protein Q4I28_007707 [Leishmania naiffi]|uniref:Uncharacterized protein n=1 Tax=Leishmania naiffi TaxID=5678 RepID=A0AAW3B5L7_9TRYP